MDEDEKLTADDEILSEMLVEEIESKPQAYLVSAAEDGDVAEARRILDSGLSIFHADCGTAAFRGAVEHHHFPIIELLVEYGFDLRLALIEAVRTTDSPEVLGYLVSSGCNLWQANEYGWRPLQYAARLGRIESLKFFIEESRLDASETDHEQITLLMLASLSSEMSEKPSTALEFLLGLGLIDANGRDITGFTSLIRASYFGFLNNTNLLLEYGADPNVQTDDGNTALMLAAGAEQSENDRIMVIEHEFLVVRRNRYPDIVQLLLDHGADADIVDKEGDRALDYAHRRGNEDIVAALM